VLPCKNYHRIQSRTHYGCINVINSLRLKYPMMCS